MADDYFDRSLAWAPDQGLVPHAVATVYALTDTELSQPLELTDLTDVPMSALEADAYGVYPPFKVVSGETDVIAVSGDLVTAVTSRQGMKGDDGVGISSVAIVDGDLVLTMSDSTTINAGPVQGVLPDAGALDDGYMLVTLGGVWTLAPVQGGGAREIQLQNASGYIQWRYVGDTAWTNLIALSALTGAPGAPGTPGSNGAAAQMRVNGGYFQWKLTTDTNWTNLIAIADLGGGAGGGRLNYNGTTWPARPTSDDPQMWVSTKYAGAPQPAAMEVGDMWIRHPDDLEAL